MKQGFRLREASEMGWKQRTAFVIALAELEGGRFDWQTGKWVDGTGTGGDLAVAACARLQAE